MLQHALDYVQKYGWSVIPVKPGDKRPLIPSWSEYQTRCPKIAEVTSWWTEHPDANIAVLTGRASGLVVLDLDGKPEGDITSFLDQHKLPSDTVVAQTGKGYHVFCKHPGGVIQNGVRIGRIDDIPVDVRGDGGYVVAPPSLHASGARYEWVKSPEKHTLAPFGDQIRALIHRSVDAQKHRGETVAELLAANNEIEEMMRGVGEGGRNHAAAKIAGFWLKVTKGDEMAALAALRVWNRLNSPPLSDGELRRTFASILERERRQHEEEETADGLRILNARQWADLVRDMEPRKGLPTPSWPGIEEMGGVVKGDMIILAGTAGSGKSTCAWGVADDLGVQQNEPGLLFSTEMTANDVARWMAARQYKTPPNSLTPRQWQLALERLSKSALTICDKASISVTQIINAVEERPETRWIIIDHIQRLRWDDDNRNQAIEAGAARLKSLAKDHGLTVILLSQMNREGAKNGGRPNLWALRDSGGLEQEADGVCFLWSPAEDRTTDPMLVNFYWAKNRHGALAEIECMFHKSIKLFKPTAVQAKVNQIINEVEQKEKLQRLLEPDGESDAA